MRAALLVTSLLAATLTIPGPASAETFGCTIIEQRTLPLMVTEPMSCTFSCDKGELELTVHMHSDSGAIKAGCGSWGMAVAFTPTCLVPHTQDLADCTHSGVHTNYVADNEGVCLLTPHEGITHPGVPMLVYSARCDARIL